MRQTTRTYLELVCQLCIYGVFLLPLVVTHSTVFPYVYPKALFFQIIVEILIFAWVPLALSSPTYRPNVRYPLNRMLLLFFAALTLATFTGADASHSFWSTPERMTGLLFYAHIAMFVLIAQVFFTSGKIRGRVLFLSVLVSACVAVAGLLEWAQMPTRYFRLTSTFGNASFLGFYAGLNVIVSAFLAKSAQHAVMRFTMILICVLNALVVYQTQARAAIIALTVSLIMSFIVQLLSRYKKITTKYLYVHCGLILIAGLTLLFAAMQAEPFLVKKSHSLSRLYATLIGDTERIALWNVGVHAIGVKPLTGWGLENFSYPLARFYDLLPLTENTSGSIYDRAHNYILDLAVFSGVAGLLAFLLITMYIFFLSLKMIVTQGDENRRWGMFLFTAALFYFIFHFFSIESPMAIVLWATIAALLISRERPAERATQAIKHNPINFTILAIGLVGLCGAAFVSNIFSMRAGLQTVQAYTLASTDLSASRLLFQDALAQHPSYARATRVALLKTASIIDGSFSKYESKDVLEFVRYMSSELNRGMSVDPFWFGWYLNSFPFYKLAYRVTSDYVDPSKRMIERGLSMVGENESFLINAATLYQAYGLTDKSIEFIKRAIHVNPMNGRYYMQLAQLYTQRGDLDRIYQIIMRAERFAFPIYDDSEFYLTFVQKIPCNKSYLDMRGLLLNGKERNQRDFNYRAALILYYNITGDRNSEQAARAELNNIDPSATELVTNLIEKKHCTSN